MKKKDLAETMEVQTFFFSMLEKVDQQLCNLKKMKHDMRDHKLIVSQIAKQEQSHVLLEHGKQLNLKFKEISIRSLLHESKKICLENDILPRFQDQFQIPEYISDIDFFRLCSNLLSNAMEACLADEETKHKYIDFSLTFEDGNLNCRIINTKPAANKVNLNVSTKDGSGYHGFGMKIVYGIIEKNNLHMETCDKGSTFCVEIFSDSIEKVKE